MKTSGPTPLMVVGILAFVVIAGLFVGVELKRSSAAPTNAAEPQCPANAKIVAEAALDSGLVEHTAFLDGGLVLVVRPTSLAAMSTGEQLDLVGAMDCAIAGDKAYLTKIMVRTRLTGPDHLVLSSTDLLRLRRGEF